MSFLSLRGLGAVVRFRPRSSRPWDFDLEINSQFLPVLFFFRFNQTAAELLTTKTSKMFSLL